MSATKRLAWLPNAITSIRLIAIVPVVVCTLTGLWEWAFAIYLVALASDFFDGMMARKLKVQSHFGAELDGISDTLLGAAVLISLMFTGYLPVFVLLGILAGALLLRYPRQYPERSKSLLPLVPMFEVGCLFLTIVYASWTYATLAFGWSGWYIPITLAILLVLAVLKRVRLRVWCAAILPAKWRA